MRKGLRYQLSQSVERSNGKRQIIELVFVGEDQGGGIYFVLPWKCEAPKTPSENILQ